MRIGALIIGFIAALTIGTMAATSTLLPALEYVQEQADRKLNELRRFANTQVHGTPGRFINNDYMEGDCYTVSMLTARIPLIQENHQSSLFFDASSIAARPDEATFRPDF